MFQGDGVYPQDTPRAPLVDNTLGDMLPSRAAMRYGGPAHRFTVPDDLDKLQGIRDPHESGKLLARINVWTRHGRRDTVDGFVRSVDAVFSEVSCSEGALSHPNRA